MLKLQKNNIGNREWIDQSIDVIELAHTMVGTRKFIIYRVDCQAGHPRKLLQSNFKDTIGRIPSVLGDTNLRSLIR